MGSVLKVSWKGAACVFKSNHDGASEQLEREIEILQILSKPRVTRANPRIAVPRLLGLVSSAEGVLGMLIEHVGGKSLERLNIAKRSPEKRKTWAKQLEHTVETLHQHNVIWGDAKASNVMIDQKDQRAWLIDFGGSYTDGWIEPQLKETKEGDLQGLGKIIEFLEDGTSDLVEPFYSDDDKDGKADDNEDL